jgi:hypothetical protein
MKFQPKPCLFFCATVFVLFATAVILPAADRELAIEESRNTLEVYLDRSDGAVAEGDWLALANAGMRSALASWERAVAQWGLDDRELAAERGGLEDVLTKDFRERYRQWMVGRFIDQRSSDPVAGFWQVVQQTNLAYLFVTQDGKARRDSLGDLVVKDLGDYQSDRASWVAAVGAARDSGLADWESRLRIALPELFGAVPADDQAKWQDTADRIIAGRRAVYSRDLAGLYDQSLQRFTCTRLYDQFSLARKSEQGAAGALATGLIDSVTASLEKELDALGASIGVGVSKVEAAGSVDSSDWQAAFRKLLDEGLDKWENAERRLLGERLAWERRTNASYQESEAAWAKALDELKTAQTAWERKIQGVLKDGENQWAAKRQDLAQAIGAAQAELEREIATRNETKANQIASLVSLYGERTQLIKTSSESGLFWFERYGAAAKGAPVSQFTWEVLNEALRRQAQIVATDFLRSWNNATARNQSLIDFIAAYEREHPAAPSEPDPAGPSDPADPADPTADPAAVDRHYRWTYLDESQEGDDISELMAFQASAAASEQACRVRYQNLAAALGRIGAAALSADDHATISLLVGNLGDYDEAAWWLTQKDEAAGDAAALRKRLTDCLGQIVSDGGDPAPLKAVINQLGASDNGYLDEYQIELIKAESLKAYWQRQVDIAQAVYDYAVTVSPERPTDARLQAEWQTAKDAYLASQGRYAQAVAALESAGTDLAGQKTAIAAARAALEAAQEEIGRQQAEYAAKKALYDSGQREYYQKQISGFHDELLKRYGLKSDPDVKGRVELLVAYRAAMADCGFEQELAAWSARLQVLVAGDGSPTAGDGQSVSLAALREAVASPPEPPASLDDPLDLPAGSGQYQAALALREEYLAAKAAGLAGDAIEAFRIRFKAVFRAHALGQERLLVERETSIKMLMAAPDDPVMSATDPVTLAAERRAAEAALARAKLAALRQTMALIADPDSTGKDVPAVVNLATLYKSGPSAWLARLVSKAPSCEAAFKTLLDAGDAGAWWSDLTRAKAGLGAVLESIADPEVRSLLVMVLNGSSGLGAGAGVDAILPLVAVEQAALDAVAAKESAARALRGASHAGQSDERSAARRKIRSRFLSDGLIPASAAEDVLAPDAAVVNTRLAKWAANGRIEDKVSSLLRDLREAAAPLSTSEQDALSRFMDGLSRQAAFHAWIHDARDSETAGIDTARETIQADMQDAQTKLLHLGVARFPQPDSGEAVRNLDRLVALAEAWEARPADHVAALTRELGLQLAQAALFATGEPASRQDPAKLRDWLVPITAPVGVDLSPLREAAVSQAAGLLSRQAYLERPAETIAPDTAAREQAVYNTLSRYAGIPIADYLSLEGLDEARRVWTWYTTARESGGLGEAWAPDSADDRKLVDDWKLALPAQDTTTAAFLDSFLGGLAGATDARELMSSLIAPAIRPFLDQIRGFGPGAAVLERAVALHLAGMVGAGSGHAAAFDFIQDMTGVESHGAVTEADFAAATTAEVFRAAFTGYTGSSDQEAVRSWYVARRFTSGEESAARADLALLDETHRAGLESWFRIEGLRREYVAGVHGNVAEYLAQLDAAGTVYDHDALRLAIAGGQTLDPFTQSRLMSETDGVGAFKGFETCWRSAGLAGLDSETGYWESRVEALRLDLALNQERRNYRTVLAGIGREVGQGLKGYRAYLDGNLVKLTDDGKAAQSAATETMASDVPGADSAAGLLHAGSGLDAGMGDYLLESFQTLTAVSGDLRAAMSQPSAAEVKAQDGRFKAAIATPLAYLFDGSSPAAWSDTKTFTVSAAKADAATNARQALDGANQTIQWLQQRIASLGSALEVMAGDQAAQQAELSRLTTAIRAKQEASKIRMADFQTLLDRFTSSTAAYNESYAAAETAWATQETARNGYELKDAIKTWAENAYLHGETGSGSANDPKKLLADAKTMLDRSSAAAAALGGLFDAEQTERAVAPFPTAAVDDYVRMGKQIQAMQEIQENLATSIQAMIDATNAAHGQLASAGRLVINSYGTNRFTTTDNPPKWAKYVVYDAVQGTFRLNLDDSFRLSERTEAQTAALAEYAKSKDYGELDPDSLLGDEAELLAWLAEQKGADATGYQAMMENWGLAADYCLQRISIANDSLDQLYTDTGLEADKAALVCVSPQLVYDTVNAEGMTVHVRRTWDAAGTETREETYVDSQGETHVSFVMIPVTDAIRDSLQWERQYRTEELLKGFLKNDTLYSRRSNEFLRVPVNFAAVGLAMEQRQAWNAVESDSRQRVMFQRMLALRLTGQLKNTKLFDDISTGKVLQSAKQVLNAETQEKLVAMNGVQSFIDAIWRQAENPLMLLNPVYQAFVATVMPPAYIALAACQYQYLSCVGFGLLVSDTPNQLSGAKAATMGSEVQQWLQANQSFLAAKAKLDTIKGTPSDGILTRSKLKNAMETGGFWSDSLSSIVDEWFGKVDAADLKDSASALDAMLRLARVASAERHETISGALRSRESGANRAIRDWQGLQARYLVGDVTASLSALHGAARSAFVSPQYTALEEARVLTGMYRQLDSGDISSSSRIEAEKTGLLGREGEALNQLQTVRMEHLESVRQDAWRRQQDDLDRKYRAWKDQVDALYAAGSAAWKDGVKQLQSAHGNWQSRFQESYGEAARQWSRNLAAFQLERKTWLEDLAVSAATTMDAVTLGRLQDTPAEAERQALLNRAGDLAASGDTVAGLVADIQANSAISEAERRAKGLAGAIAAVATKVRTGLRADANAARDMADLARIQFKDRSALTSHGAKILAIKAQETLAKARADCMTNVGDANANFQDSMDATFLNAGFQKVNGAYARRSVIAAPLASIEYENQYVTGFKPFAMPDFTVKTSLDEGSLQGYDADGIQAQVSKALKEIQEAMEAVFGKKDEKGKKVVFRINGGKGADTDKALADQADWGDRLSIIDLGDSGLREAYTIENFNLGEAWNSLLANQDSTSRITGATEVRTMGAGTFNAYLGYTPVFKAMADVDNNDLEAGYQASVIDPGVGELGRLMGRFIYFQMRQGKGMSEVGIPITKKKFWNDRGSWFKAPTFELMLDMGASVAAACNPYAGLIAGAVDGILTGVIEGHNDSSKVGEVIFEKFKEFGVRAASFGIGKAFEGAMIAAKGIADAAGRTFAIAGVGLAQGVTTNIVTGAINSMSMVNGHFDFNMGAYMNSVIGKNALAGYASSFVGAVTSNALETVKLTGFNELQQFNAGKFASFAGSAAGAGVSYALTGQLDLNLLNLGDFTGGRLSSGLLELHLNGEGASMNLGTGGMNMSLGTLVQAAQGLGVYDLNAQIEGYSAASGNDVSTLLRAQFGFGDSLAIGQAEGILNGSIDFLLGGSGAIAQTTVSEVGRRTVQLGSAPGADDESQLRAAITLEHEAYRNGRNDGVVGQFKETVNAVVGHMGMADRMLRDSTTRGLMSNILASDSVLYNDFSAYQYAQATNNSGDFLSYVGGAYDSSADYWKVRVENGKVLTDWDGTQDVTLPDGTVIKADKDTGKVSASKLAMALFGNDKNSKAIEALFNSSGATWSDKTKSWNFANGNAIGKTDAFSVDLTSLIDGSKTFSSQFNNWLSGGMSGVALAQMGGLPDGTFAYVNTNRLLGDAASQVGGLVGTPIAKLTALRTMSMGDLSQIGNTMLIGTGSFADQYNRFFSAFVGHIGNTVLPGGAHGVTGDDSIAVYDGAKVLKDRAGKWVHGGGDINVNIPVRDMDNGMDITAPFSGRTATSNELGLIARDIRNPGRLVYESGFSFGNRFVNTGLYGAFSHANVNSQIADLRAGSKFFDANTTLGTVSNLGATNNHLHQELMSNPKSTNAAWFENLFNNIVFTNQFSRSDLKSAKDVQLNRKYYNVDLIWQNLWRY